MLILFLYSITLPGFEESLNFLFKPNFKFLLDPLVWSAAFGQVFFSFSVGQGIMLTYGSYIREESDILRSSIFIAISDTFVALLSGVIIFSIVFSFGLEPSSGTQLAFTTLPQAFSEISFGCFIAISFFGVLFLAALSSAVQY